MSDIPLANGDEIDETLAAKLREMQPVLCDLIDDWLGRGAKLRDIQRVIQQTKAKMGANLLHQYTAEAMIEAYTTVKLKEKRGKNG